MKATISVLPALVFICAFVAPLHTVTSSDTFPSETNASYEADAATDYPVVDCTYDTLYPARHDGKWGYIDSSGAWVIQPRFYAAKEFYGGLAIVRSEGMYGYIRTNGEFAIPPRFDYALHFRGDRAKVYIDGKPLFIDRKGDILFQHNFAEIEEFYAGIYATAKAHSGLLGLIDRAGRLVVDTAFTKIDMACDSIAVVCGRNHSPYARPPVWKIGAVDLSGKWIVPYGVYRDIDDFYDGYASVVPIGAEEEEEREQYIDTKGRVMQKEVLSTLDKEYVDEYSVSDELSVVSIPFSEAGGKRSYDKAYYKGIADSSGAIVISDTTWTMMVGITPERFFVERNDKDWILIDAKGRRITDLVFDEIELDHSIPPREGADNVFASIIIGNACPDGRAMVRTADGYGAIDTAGWYVVGPRTFDFNIRRFLRVEDRVFFFNGDDRVKGSARIGFWNIRTGVVVKPEFEYITIPGFGRGLSAAVKDGREVYLNSSGDIVWSESPVENNVLNIDYMNPTVYYAASRYENASAGSRSRRQLEHAARPLTPDIPVGNKGLQLVLDPTRHRKWNGEYEGMALYIVNSSDDTTYSNVIDDRLRLTMQALDRNGTWRDIECHQHTTCGNSYYTIFIAPGQYWEVAAPVYEGGFKTRLRACLTYRTDLKHKEEKAIYSNEIEGSVNFGQFWRKK